MDFPGGASDKESAAIAGDIRDTGLIPGQEDPLKESMTPDSSILAWRLPWTEKLQSIHRVAKSCNN